jgi:3-methyladenine DNA glycosylase/8-oxoguanine DNA glycosylase
MADVKNMHTMSKAISVKTPRAFRLATTVRSHGWYDLAPFRWDGSALARVLRVGGRAVDAVIRVRSGSTLEVALTGATGARAEAEARTQLTRMLHLDAELEALYALTDAHPPSAWARGAGAGRLLRAPTAFEDTIKILLTTNCSWSLTRAMVTRLLDALGDPAPSGARAFPTPERMARENERFYRDVVRAGYRAPHLCALARAAADGRLDPDAWARAGDTAALRERLLELPGFGPYATDNLMRLLGAYDGLGLDSWCRARLKKLYPRIRAVDAFAERLYRPFGHYRGLVMWLELTRAWHEGSPPASFNP